MKAEINCPILSSEKFSKEVLNDIVNSLEKLENTKNTIFNRLNTAFSERVNKLCNIKARINRANQIIASYSSITDAITLKSKYHYPTQKHYYYTPTIIDQNATSMTKEPALKLNKIVLNDKANLGSKSLAAKDKMATYDKFLSFATQFNDIVNQLDKIATQEVSVRQSLDDFEPILNHVTNDFTFGTNMKIEYAKKQQYNPQQDNNRGNSMALQEFLNEKKEEERKRKKIIQQAPKSILEKEKLKKYKKKRKKLISKTSTSKMNFNLPTNIGLGGVAELDEGDDEEEKVEEKNEEEEEEDDDDFKDDIQNDPQLENQDEETDLPIDYIRYNNKNKIEANKNSQNISYSTNNYQRPVNTNNNNNNNTNTYTNNNVNTTTQVQSNNTVTSPPQSEPPKPIVSQPPPQPKAPSPLPSVPSSSTVQVVVSNASGVPPPPPPPPPPPMVPTIPTKPSASKVVKNDGPEISLEEELAKAKSGLKKKVEVQEKPKELSFAEQLAMSRNQLRAVAPQPKQVETKPKLDILSQQIKLRFHNLRLHEEDNEEENEEEEDKW